jgi:hypothetical protein
MTHEERVNLLRIVEQKTCEGDALAVWILEEVDSVLFDDNEETKAAETFAERAWSGNG